MVGHQCPNLRRNSVAAYMIAPITIDDMDQFNEYRRQVLPTIQNHDGRVLAAEGPVTPTEGEWPGSSTVIIEFPSVERAQQWYDSDEYDAPKALRKRASKANLVFLRGLGGTAARRSRSTRRSNASCRFFSWER